MSHHFGLKIPFPGVEHQEWWHTHYETNISKELKHLCMKIFFIKCLDVKQKNYTKLFSGCGQVLFGGTGLGNYRPAVLQGLVPIGLQFKLGGKTIRTSQSQLLRVTVENPKNQMA